MTKWWVFKIFAFIVFWMEMKKEQLCSYTKCPQLLLWCSTDCFLHIQCRPLSSALFFVLFHRELRINLTLTVMLCLYCSSVCIYNVLIADVIRWIRSRPCCGQMFVLHKNAQECSQHCVDVPYSCKPYHNLPEGQAHIPSLGRKAALILT